MERDQATKFVNDLLKLMISRNGSDLFITADFPPAIKVDGKPLDKAQWSRWASGQEGVVWPKLVALMDFCGNDAPLLWMLKARGYDLTSLRKMESETERMLRLANERIQQLEHEREVERRLFRDLRVGA